MKKLVYSSAVAIILAAVILIAGCTPKARYERKLKNELSRGVRNDSIFLGLYLGMTQKDFYLHCWNLNKKGLVKQGPDNKTVEYMLKSELTHPAAMNFYPTFSDGKVVEMPVRFTYSGWAPWNKAMSADSLQIEVLTWFKQKYGSDFMMVEHAKRGKAFINIKGNRRITIFKDDDINVWAIFSDMLIIKDKKITPAVINLEPKSDSLIKSE